MNASPWALTGSRAVLFGAMLLLGCRENPASSSDLATSGAGDMSSSGDGGGTVDMAKAPPKPTTIRAINDGTSGVNVGGRVKITGVVISPFMFTDENGGRCYYRINIVQSDGSPATLKDGMVITTNVRASVTTDMSLVAQCINQGKTVQVVAAMDALKIGDLVEIEGTYDVRASGGQMTRQIDVFGGTITGMGQAAMMPTPVDADPAMFARGSGMLPTAFVDAHGAFVRFKNVKVFNRDAMYQDFYVSASGMAPGPYILTRYPRILNSGYMSPANGTTLASVTGIVLGDFSGSIWLRNSADVMP
jgi:hypothetical protein